MLKKISVLLAILPSIVLAQHSIKGKFQPKEKFTFAILYRVSPTTSVYVANAEIKKEDGSYEFKLDSTAVPSTYRIVYGLPQEDNNFDLIYSGKEDVEVDFIFDKGALFKSSKENVTLNLYRNSIAKATQQFRDYYASNNTSKKDFKNIVSNFKTIQEEFEEKAKGTMALEYIKASSPYLPEEYIDAKTFTANVKKNYFNNIDFSNETLQNSNFLIESVLSYVFNYIDKSNLDASLKENIDTALKAVGTNTPKIKNVIIKILYQQMMGAGNEVAANHVGINYLLPLAKEKNDKGMITDIMAYKNTSIGEVAPDFTVEIPDEKGKIQLKKMHDLDVAENYLIAFWSTTCSHCLEELPLLKAYAKTVDKKKLKVIAIGLEEQIYRWKDMTADYPDFINVFGEGKWENPIGDAYNVTGTPTFFFLDKDKKIINKPDDFYAFKKYYDVEYKKIAPKKAEVKATTEIKETVKTEETTPSTKEEAVETTTTTTVKKTMPKKKRRRLFGKKRKNKV